MTQQSGRMVEQPLRERAEELLRAALKQIGNHPRLRALERELTEAQARLRLPMRVAIVGKIKSGKSTTMNAILGAAVVPMGAVETTFNVSWLKYGDPSSLLVRFKDGSPDEVRSFDELERLTRRDPKQQAILTNIRYIEVAYPHPLLHIFNLIDTPGLESFYADDSQNTLDFLRLHGHELHEVTQDELANADAVLYLFARHVHQSDQEILSEFHGDSVEQITPINSIGVLTKIDATWPSSRAPMDIGADIAGRISTHPAMRRLFYTVVPIIGLVALGAQTLTPEHYDILCRLAALRRESLEYLLQDARRFSTRDVADIPIAPKERQQVLALLGRYGVWWACIFIREQQSTCTTCGREELMAALLDHSGVGRLRDLITTHFGQRALLIKLGASLRRIHSACVTELKQCSAADRAVVEDIDREFDRLQAEEHAFQELQVLRDAYEGKLRFNDNEMRHLLEVTGEYGTSCGERLGLGERALVREMLPVAEERRRYWRRRSNDRFGADSVTLASAKVLARSYERIIYHVREAEKHLYL